MLAKSKIESVANEINFLKSKEKNVIINLLKFAISETTLYYRRNIITKNLFSSTFIELKNLLIILIVLNCEEDNVNKRVLLF